jgi:hypothetical protein
VALGPVWLDLDSLFGVGERLFVFLLGGVDGGAVGVEDVVVGVELDCLSELLTALISCLSKLASPKRGKPTWQSGSP